MKKNIVITRYDAFKALGKCGRRVAVDLLMRELREQGDFLTTKLVDFTLGLVRSREGSGRIRRYLFLGAPIQRNYAALYFKRRGALRLLAVAVFMGRVDRIQAYSK